MDDENGEEEEQSYGLWLEVFGEKMETSYMGSEHLPC